MNDVIPNHSLYQRQVIFDTESQITMVRSAKRTPPCTTTFQGIEHSSTFKLIVNFNNLQGDALSIANVRELILKRVDDMRFEDAIFECLRDFLRVHFKYFTAEIFCEYIHQPDRRVAGDEVQTIFSKIPVEIQKYLLAFNPYDARYNLLPEGYGWDGRHTSIEIERANKVKQLLIGEYEWKDIDDDLIERIYQKTLFTPANMLMLSWDKAFKFKDDDILYLGLTRSDSETIIIGQTKDLSQRIEVDSVPTDKQTFSFKPPKEWDRFIGITTNILAKGDSEHYGIRLRLFQRSKDDVT